jgi:cell division septation protein DedD
MDISLKKRVVGILLLIGLGLIIIPLFFGRSAPLDEMQLSGSIPKPPAKPRDLALAIPPAQETTPAPLMAQPTNNPTPASRVVFEQVQSTPSSTSTSNNNNMTSSPSTTAAVPQMLAPPSPTTVATNTPTLSLPPVPATAVIKNPTANQSQQTTTVTNVSARANAVQQPIARLTASVAPSTSSVTLAPTSAVKTPMASQAISTKTTQRVAAKSVGASPAAWVVQLGSFSAKINAETLMKKLQAGGFAAYSHIIKTPQGDLIKVVAGPYLQRTEANNAQLKIQQSFNLKGIVVKTGV